MSAAGTNIQKMIGVPDQEASDQPARIPRLNERLTDELVIALVGPVGSGCTTTYEKLSDILGNQYSYDVHYYKLSDYIAHGAKLVHKTIPEHLPAAERVDKLQTVGDMLRKACGHSYLAAKAVEKIAELRDIEGFGNTAEGVAVPKKLRQVHIIDSVKHPEELKLLRSTYGEIFWLIGVFAPLSVREQRLTVQQNLNKAALGAIIQRDYREEDDHGQKVRDVFYQSDFFVRNDRDNTLQLEKALSRFIEIIFGSPVHTPTLDESSMYAAYAEAAKSACLSRQVGAAIVSAKNELIGLGRNDVPQYSGGLYTEDAGDCDNRCHAWQDRRCHNDKKKDALYQQIFENLKRGNLLAEGARLEEVAKAIKATDAKSLIEYSRAVHAEMDAIISVARTNKAGLLGGMLYSTTFPCHSCARHIVASGIMKVLFIEPYPKSLATELHSDAVSESEGDSGKKVLFLQYSGIAPKNILKLFNVGLTRKSGDGKLKPFDKKSASPVVKVSLDDYSTHEKWVIAELAENEQQASQGIQSTLFDV
jgi:deoxycytidylate deaminase